MGIKLEILTQLKNKFFFLIKIKGKLNTKEESKIYPSDIEVFPLIS